MRFKAEIKVMPLKELLDPQGKTVSKNLKNLNITQVEDVRIGKNIEMTFEANDETQANEKVEAACKKLLSNMVMESYEYRLETLS